MLTWPALIATNPGASVVALINAVVPPTTPPKVLVPAVLSTKVWAPSTVLPKVIVPDEPVPLLVSVVAAPKFIASL